MLAGFLLAACLSTHAEVCLLYTSQPAEIFSRETINGITHIRLGSKVKLNVAEQEKLQVKMCIRDRVRTDKTDIWFVASATRYRKVG